MSRPQIPDTLFKRTDARQYQMFCFANFLWGTDQIDFNSQFFKCVLDASDVPQSIIKNGDLLNGSRRLTDHILTGAMNFLRISAPQFFFYLLDGHSVVMKKIH